MSVDHVATQKTNLDRMLEDAFEYHVVDGSRDQQAAIKDAAAQHGAVYHRCEHVRLDACMDWSVASVAAPFAGAFVVFANVDMFLVKPWSVARHFKAHGSPDVMAVVEDHMHHLAPHAPLTAHLHPNLFMLNTTSTRASMSALSFAQWPGTDVGGATRAFVDAHATLRVVPLMWSRHVDHDSLVATGLISRQVRAMLEEQAGSAAAPDLYASDFAWYHVRDVTCWTGSCTAASRKAVTGRLHQLLDAAHAGGMHYADASPDPVQWGTLLRTHAASTTSGNAIATVDRDGVLTGLPQSGCADGAAEPRSACLTKKNVVLRPRYGFNSDTWMHALYDQVLNARRQVRLRADALQAAGRLPLPAAPRAPRSNLHLTPLRYDRHAFVNDISYYWRYVYNGTQDAKTQPEVPCAKKPGQRYWAVSVAIGDVRKQIANMHTRPTCLQHAVDEFVLLTDDDFDDDFRTLNAQTLASDRGKGMWIWKHWAQYKVLERMAEGDILFYIDSDFRCSNATPQYFCLAQHHDVVGFHHSHPDYTLARLASRDAMILMDLDTPEVATSVQSSGGNIMFRKTPFAVAFVREMGSWSQQHEVACCYGQASKLGDDWPQFAQRMEHQCDQAVSSLMLVKHGLKTFPWHMEGPGSGSDDVLNAAQRRECGLDGRAMTVHVQDDGAVSWREERPV